MESRASMNISLPDSMREWIEDVVRRDGYGTVSEYIRELVRNDQKQRDKKALDAKLLEALESGPMTEMTASDWERIRREVRERVSRRAGKKAG
jgi:antitoxin ParD1/3/4